MSDENKIVGIVIFIERSTWTWGFSFTSERSVVQDNMRISDEGNTTPSLLLNPDKTFKAFGRAAQRQYSELLDENRRSCLFFENITSYIESGQARSVDIYVI